MLKPIFLLFMMQAIFWPTKAQDATAFEVVNNKLYQFNSGIISLLEFQDISNLLIGNKFLAYADTRGDYYAVYKGKKTQITRGQTNLIKTNNYLAYQISSVLRVFDQGETNILTSYVGSYGVGDSLIVFQDQIGGNLKYFYKNEIIEFAQVLGDYYVSSSHIGANVFVYRDNADNYKAFYNGYFYDLLRTNQEVNFSAGLNVIAFNDNMNYTFSVFNQGEVFDLESDFALKFQAGHNFVYYQDNNEVNKVYSNGDVMDLGYDLQEVAVYDSIIFFKEVDYPKIWYKNEVHTFYNAQFSNYQVSGGCLAYINSSGGVSAFIRGELIDITRQKVQGFELNGNTIVLKYAPSSYSVWWNGKMFDF